MGFRFRKSIKLGWIFFVLDTCDLFKNEKLTKRA